MYDKFLKLPKEKKEKIIRVSLIEFADNGFVNASTNVIVNEAGISKGALFNYFKSKKNLYFYLADYCIDIIAKEMFECEEIKNPDIITKLIEIARVKFNIFRKNPILYSFIMTFYKETPFEIENEFRERYINLKDQNFSKLYEEIDYSLFKKEVDIKKAIKILTWTIESFGDEKLKEIRLKFKKDTSLQTIEEEYLEEIIEELKSYLDIFRDSFYI